MKSLVVVMAILNAIVMIGINLLLTSISIYDEPTVISDAAWQQLLIIWFTSAAILLTEIIGTSYMLNKNRYSASAFFACLPIFVLLGLIVIAWVTDL